MRELKALIYSLVHLALIIASIVTFTIGYHATGVCLLALWITLAYMFDIKYTI